MHRRTLLAQIAGLPALAAAVPSLPEGTLLTSDPDRYWRRIREEQFFLPDWRAFLNNGSLGIAPKRVLSAVEDFLERSAGLQMEEYPRWGYEPMDAHRQALADFVGCKKDEIALTHNATEALGIVASGLDLQAGDEVIMTDQEHPSCVGPWRVREARHGIKLRQVEIPLPPKSPEQLAELMISAIGPRTKVLVFSGILTTTGLVMPVREICQAARAKGVMTMVDGAHMHGQIPFRVDELGCDFMAGSPHKWLFAPAGCGLLYIREEMQDRVWPSVAVEGWKNPALKAARFMQVGTNNRALFEGMVAGLEFAKQIGPEKIMARNHQLARTVLDRAKKYSYLKPLTPDDDRMFGSLVCVQMDPDLFKKFYGLCRQRKIWVQGAERFRVSIHVHTRPQDIDLMFRTLEEAHG